MMWVNTHQLMMKIYLRTMKKLVAYCLLLIVYCPLYWLITFNSVLLFFARPTSVALSAIGWVAPKPLYVKRWALMPASVRYFTTSFARFSESTRLSFALPILSVCPLIWILSVGFSLSSCTTLSSSTSDSSFKLYSFKSKKIFFNTIVALGSIGWSPISILNAEFE